MSEEVEQWRSERRSKFPTKKTVEQKQEELTKLMEMGGLSVNQISKGKRAEKNAVNSTVQCRFFAKFGKCRHGDKCRLLHGKPKHAGGPIVQTASPSLAENGAPDLPATSLAEGSEQREEGPGIPDQTTTITDSNESNTAPKFATAGVEEDSRKRKLDGKNKEKRPAKHGKVKDGLFLPDPFDGGTRGTLLKNLLKHEIAAEENILLQCIHFLAAGFNESHHLNEHVVPL